MATTSTPLVQSMGCRRSDVPATSGADAECARGKAIAGIRRDDWKLEPGDGMPHERAGRQRRTVSRAERCARTVAEYNRSESEIHKHRAWQRLTTHGPWHSRPPPAG